MQKKKLAWVIGIAVICPLILLLLQAGGAFERFELMAFDTLTQAVRSSVKSHPDVAVILIDEASLKAMNPVVGRWPWPRALYADLLDFLSMGNPSAVAFDILFTENEGFSEGGLGLSDRALVDATRISGKAYHAQQILIDEEDELNKSLLGKDMPQGFRERFAVKTLKAPSGGNANNFYLPFKELYDASHGIGVVEFAPDPDNILRRTKPLRQYKNDYFPVLGIAPVIDRMGVKKISMDKDSFMLDDLRVPLDGNGQYLINMYGQYNTYSISGIFASLQKIYNGETKGLLVTPEEFRNKIIFVGASAAGVEDMKPTAISKSTPGVFLHASTASNMLMRDFLTPPSHTLTTVLVIIFSVGTVLCVLLSSKTYIKLGAPAAVMVLYAGFVYYRFTHNALNDMVAPTASVVLPFLVSFVYLSLTEGRERRKIRKMLGQYVSPHMLSQIVDKHEDLAKAEVGTREYVTVLFSDIRGFTSISENEPPERIVSMLNQYFSIWSDAIFSQEGTIDKFVGDAVMALWGAPLRTNTHPEQAVRAALKMREALPGLNAKLMQEGYPEIKIGVGIHTGHAILGNIGSERKLDFTVIGDTVNLSSRLEGLTKQYSCDILISESTYEHIKDLFECEYLDEVRVKGKEKAVRIYTVIGGRK